MTAIAELERIAERVVPPISATGWRITVLETRPATVYAVVPVLGGRLDGAPVFSGVQRDAHTMYELLAGDRSTSRSARRSVAETGLARLGPAEGRADQAADASPAVSFPPADVVDERHASSTARRQQGNPRSQARVAAGSRPGPSPTTPVVVPGSVLATGSSSSLEPGVTPAGPTPAGVRRCKACGMSLEGRGPGQGQPRQTCDDACRQAYRRGARAPEPGVVTPAAIEALSRLPKPEHEAVEPDSQPLWGEDL